MFQCGKLHLSHSSAEKVYLIKQRFFKIISFLNTFSVSPAHNNNNNLFPILYTQNSRHDKYTISHMVPIWGTHLHLSFHIFPSFMLSNFVTFSLNNLAIFNFSSTVPFSRFSYFMFLLICFH